MNQDQQSENIRIARQLLSGRFQGILSTHSTEIEGYPFGSLVPYSIDRDGWPMVLVSDLAKHTRNLIADSRCSLTLVEQGSGDIQQLSRLVCLSDAKPISPMNDQSAERHFRYFPESREYYLALNFRFYRLIPKRFYAISGFGAARWAGVDRMERPNPYNNAEEQEALNRINLRYPKRLARLGGASEIETLAVGLDPWGLDARRSDAPVRFEFSKTMASITQLLEWLESWLPAEAKP